jgi:hypothetical protein
MESVEGCECALHVEPIDNCICMSHETLNSIKKGLNVNLHSNIDSLEKIKTKLDLISSPESKILEHPIIHKIIGPDIANKELVENFKPIGPWDEVPLNNFEVDSVLDQWKLKWDNYINLHFNMIDFANHNGSMTIPISDLIEKKITKFQQKWEDTPINLCTVSSTNPKYISCVLNSGKYGSGGKHWTAIFINIAGLEWTLEFFNSSGNPPYPEVEAWWGKNKVQLEKYIEKNNLPNKVKCVKVSDIMHQRASTTCGPYSLYYIWSRLNGVDYLQFKHTEITDDIVQNFTRTHLYRDKKNQ